MILLWIFALYILAWSAAVFYAGRYSWRYTQSKTKTAAICMVVFLVMYWPPFGDLIPTLWAHKQYCEKEAGFKVLVTPEQWAAENPGVLETLAPYQEVVKHESGYLLNQRIKSVHFISQTGNPALRRAETDFLDIKDGRPLSKHVDFLMGYSYLGFKKDTRSIKLWLNENSCFDQKKYDDVYRKENNFTKLLNAYWKE